MNPNHIGTNFDDFLKEEGIIMHDRFKFRFFETYNNTMLDCKDYDFNEILESGKPVMQSTGLKDKNGKLIYEGDIVNVKINCSACEVKTKQKCQYCSQYFQTIGHTNFKDFYNNEVIGNIYENPELLEGEE